MSEWRQGRFYTRNGRQTGMGPVQPNRALEHAQAGSGLCSGSVLHEPARVEPGQGLEPARRMSEETRAARALRQGSSLNLLIDPRYQVLKGRT